MQILLVFYFWYYCHGSGMLIAGTVNGKWYNPCVEQSYLRTVDGTREIEFCTRVTRTRRSVVNHGDEHIFMWIILQFIWFTRAAIRLYILHWLEPDARQRRNCSLIETKFRNAMLFLRGWNRRRKKYDTQEKCAEINWLKIAHSIDRSGCLRIVSFLSSNCWCLPLS